MTPSSKTKSTPKRPSRKAELIRLAAKQGWYDGQSGGPAVLPQKVVMRPGCGVGFNPVPKDEQDSYLRGHAEGCAASQKDKNPYGVYK